MTTAAGDMNDPLIAAARRLAEIAREEDLGPGDITSRLIAQDGTAQFALVAREPCVVAGQRIAQTVLDTFDPAVKIRWNDNAPDGTVLSKRSVELARIEGSIQAVLNAERVLLNFLQRLCGVATLTRNFVDAVAGMNARILDTRKTIPGWRHLDKYAVRCGGGFNHRMGLYDAVLIKDNHLAHMPVARTAGTVFEMLSEAAALDPPPRFIEVEADTLEQVEQLFNVVGIDVILLDNFTLPDLRRAVQLRDSRNLRGKVRLEASGGITLDTAAAVASTGVDDISVGAITHSAPAADLALDRV